MAKVYMRASDVAIHSISQLPMSLIDANYRAIHSFYKRIPVYSCNTHQLSPLNTVKTASMVHSIGKLHRNCQFDRQ